MERERKRVNVSRYPITDDDPKLPVVACHQHKKQSVVISFSTL